MRHYIYLRKMRSYLNERIALLMIDLHSDNWVSRLSSANLHLEHLAIEELLQVGFVSLVRDAPHIQAARLAGEVWSARARSKGSLAIVNRWERASHAKNVGHNLGPVCARKVEHAYEMINKRHASYSAE